MYAGQTDTDAAICTCRKPVTHSCDLALLYQHYVDSENLSDFSVEVVEPNRWQVTFQMPAGPGSAYPGETHRLEFTFCDQYPIESPQVW